jgi:hypothetical protein
MTKVIERLPGYLQSGRTRLSTGRIDEKLIIGCWILVGLNMPTLSTYLKLTFGVERQYYNQVVASKF